MSTIDSTESLNSHNRTHSHSYRGQRLSRPFSLARIPSERLDPRSINYSHTAGGHDRGQKGREYNISNGATFAKNGSINAPSIHRSGQLQRISKRAEVTAHSPKPVGASHSLLDQIPRLSAESKAELSATEMESNSRWAFRSLQDNLNKLTLTQDITATYEN
jgi:hypothetical protein